jgi:two-component system, chemotaxis family, chemotaxis protein CheY
MPTVLVIDDEADVRDSIQQVLGRIGFTVTTAVDGVAGIRDFLEHPVDVVIVDIIMPHSNGIEVIKKVRAQFPGARILAISGGGNFAGLGYRPGTITTEAYLASAMQSGADAIMSKPFRRDELIAVVRSLVKN